MADRIALYYEIVKALRAGDDEVTRQYFDPSFIVYEDEGLPYGGVYRGSDAFIQLRKKVSALFALKILYVCAEPDGDRVAVVFSATGRPEAPTRSVETTVTVLWTFRGERAVEARVIYYNTPQVAAALAAA
jgi:ketosteroid isomerase-like protein